MISFFAKSAFLREDQTTGVFVTRVSSRIRGEEISEYLGAKYNPEERDGLCIYLKPRGLDGLKDGDYVDILDEISLIPKLKERPGLKVIAMSQAQYEYLKENLKNEILPIHHHHINFERFRRTRNDNFVGGAIGHSKYAHDLYETIKNALSGSGIDFVSILAYQTRQDMLDFFKKIDFLVAWNIDEYKDYPHSHPTKIINAASFGIPTLTQPIAGYKEFAEFYIPIKDMNSLVEEAEKLRDIDYYKQWSDKVFDESERYHISKIAELYKQLK
jgi:hypothetical protein